MVSVNFYHSLIHKNWPKIDIHKIDTVFRESNVEYETHLAPQAMFELGLIALKDEDYEDAQALFDDTQRYTNYATEFLINHRIRLLMSNHFNN